MKVVFLDTTLDGSLIGGAHTFLHQILGGLSKRGIEVHFITKGHPVAKTAQNIENAGGIFHNTIWPKDSLTEDSAPLLVKWLEKLKPDVYVVSVSPDIGWVVLPSLSPGIATFAIGHNDSDTFYLPAKHYAQFLTKAVGVSEEICRRYVSRSGLNEKDVTWIPYGVESYDGPLNKNKSGTVSIVYVGRLQDEQKRASDLIKIVRELTKQNVDFKMKIIGDGVLAPVLARELANEISRSIVELPGWLNTEELLKNLRASDIFVLTSEYEGFCISLVEAMANGCCPVVTDIASGNKQLVSDGENGFVVPVGGIKEFAEKVASLAMDREKLFQLRQKAWDVGKSYTIDKMVDRYCESFKGAIQEVKRNPRRTDPAFPLMESCRSSYPLWLRRIKQKAKTFLSAI
jgi:glycosyltransferase involved in cell wall biosynthesis